MHSNNIKQKVLLGVNSGIGAKDTIQLINKLLEFSEVKVILTRRATEFFKIDDINLNVEIFNDDSDWYTWEKRGDKILHIELRNWANVLLIAPLSANTLAKLVNGACDNLLLTVARAWKLKEKPVILAPSMNKYMWEHPITSDHLEKARSWGMEYIMPRCKLLAGGDFGMGALEKSNVIADFVKTILERFRSVDISL